MNTRASRARSRRSSENKQSPIPEKQNQITPIPEGPEFTDEFLFVESPELALLDAEVPKGNAAKLSFNRSSFKEDGTIRVTVGEAVLTGHVTNDTEFLLLQVDEKIQATKVIGSSYRANIEVLRESQAE